MTTTTTPSFRQSVAVGIVSRNEADELDACLATVPWATEIYVLDMQSTDHTVEVANRYGATVIKVRDAPVAEQVRNHYVLRFEADWLLQLDCDERLHPDWRTMVDPILEAEFDTDVAAYQLPFRLVTLGAPIDHGIGRNSSVRLFRRGRVRYLDDQPAHRNPLMDGSLQTLVDRVPPIDHHTFPTIDAMLEKFVRYAKTESLELKREDLDSLVVLRHFYQAALVNDGWKDGFPGIAFAMAFAFSRGLAHLYAWERLGGGPIPMVKGRPNPTSKAGVRRLINEARSDEVIGRLLGGDPTRATEVKDRIKNAFGDDPGLAFRPQTVRHLAFAARRAVLKSRQS
jgi:glycosyltransferase involved in cell wall biosynthesis